MVKAQALAGLLTAVISMRDRNTSTPRRQQLLTISGGIIYALKSRPTRRFLLEDPDNPPRYASPRSYDIIKSNTLDIMRGHRNDEWYRQFFRQVHI